MDGANIAKTKIDLSSVPLPGLEDFASGFEFDRTKFVRTLGCDLHSHHGKANMTVKHTWTPKDNKHIINSCKKATTEDLGGFKAFIKVSSCTTFYPYYLTRCFVLQNEIDVTHESGKDQTYDVKGSIVLQGDEWKAGVSGEMLQKGNKVEALALYDMCSSAKLWATVAADFPQAAHNKVALGW